MAAVVLLPLTAVTIAILHKIRRKKTLEEIPNFQTEAQPELFTPTEINNITHEIVENKVNSMIEKMEVDENNQPSATVIDVDNESENLNNNEQKAEEEV